MFDKIKTEYAKLYEKLLEQNKLIRPTELGYSGAASAIAVHNFFKKIKLDKYNSFVDLGSGDGKVVMIASLFTNAVGIEVDDELIKTARKIAKKLKIGADFIQTDFLEANVSEYDIIFINPDQPMYAVEKKLRNEMTPEQRLIVFGGLYKPMNMKLEKNLTVDGVWFGVYCR